MRPNFAVDRPTNLWTSRPSPSCPFPAPSDDLQELYNSVFAASVTPYGTTYGGSGTPIPYGGRWPVPAYGGSPYGGSPYGGSSYGGSPYGSGGSGVPSPTPSPSPSLFPSTSPSPDVSASPSASPRQEYSVSPAPEGTCTGEREDQQTGVLQPF